jgi:hypothetical protein
MDNAYGKDAVLRRKLAVGQWQWQVGMRILLIVSITAVENGFVRQSMLANAAISL